MTYPNSQDGNYTHFIEWYNREITPDVFKLNMGNPGTKMFIKKKKPALILFRPNDRDYTPYFDVFMSAAQKFKGQILFIDVPEGGQIAD